jgi:hypothetical protein
MGSSVLGCIRTSQPRRFLFFSGKKSQGVDERHVVLVGQHLYVACFQSIHMNKKGVRAAFKTLARPLKMLAQNSESRRKEKRAYTLDPRAVNLSTKCGV